MDAAQSLVRGLPIDRSCGVLFGDLDDDRRRAKSEARGNEPAKRREAEVLKNVEHGRPTELVVAEARVVDLVLVPLAVDVERSASLPLPARLRGADRAAKRHGARLLVDASRRRASELVLHAWHEQVLRDSAAAIVDELEIDRLSDRLSIIECGSHGVLS